MEQRESVEHSDGARVAVEQLPEVRLTQPAVDTGADLDAQHFGNVARSSEAVGEVHLTEPAFAEQPVDRVPEGRLGTFDDLAGAQQLGRPRGGRAARRRGVRRATGWRRSMNAGAAGGKVRERDIIVTVGIPA